MGLVANGLAPLPGVVLNLGSHWKAISLDENGRIVSSVTSLSGEMIHAVQTTTILTLSARFRRNGRRFWTWLGSKPA